MKDLYGQLILDHAKNPQHAGLREPYDVQIHQVNPTCGDEVTLRVRLANGPDGQVLEDLSYDSLGCSISIASASILAEECLGRPVAETLETYRHLRTMLASKGKDPGDIEQIGDGVAFAGVSRYPARIKCALLAWTAYVDALARAGIDISELFAATGDDQTH
ncbi:MAG: SUF system NifU family Fe-S cluster assembly protein [Ornithinimicrobium sp.]|uniref:Fe-S cluster assembly sulfur transfer protein SufU n=1 Tax=Ornithinimicrobium sp. TaxID=1977084 RepID=UPI0026DFF198|nr:SUF system NifU family Fe-S cluster assembly protein [Ornithinimicrobium sp.]MDO5738657.1 SUF system NifU family Fe-S cluster assembly protein [Ornithinimicrobium sp.]